MASGHVNRIERPNTWLHRPMLQNVKKVLANPEPSTHGTKRTSSDVRLESVMRSKADIGESGNREHERLGIQPSINTPSYRRPVAAAPESGPPAFVPEMR
jgi:hypothetical protein